MRVTKYLRIRAAKRLAAGIFELGESPVPIGCFTYYEPRLVNHGGDTPIENRAWTAAGDAEELEACQDTFGDAVDQGRIFMDAEAPRELQAGHRPCPRRVLRASRAAPRGPGRGFRGLCYATR